MTATCGELFLNVAGALVPNVPKPLRPAFLGTTYSEPRDKARLTGQLARVRDCMTDGKWRSLAEIAEITGDPEASVSARLRDLRRPANGFYTVKRRQRSTSQFEYRMTGGL